MGLARRAKTGAIPFLGPCSRRVKIQPRSIFDLGMVRATLVTSRLLEGRRISVAQISHLRGRGPICDDACLVAAIHDRGSFADFKATAFDSTSTLARAPLLRASDKDNFLPA